MISCSRSVRALPLLLAAAAACQSETVYTTPVIAALPETDLSTFCLGEAGVDTALVEVFEYVGDPGAPPVLGTSACDRCGTADGGATCVPLEGARAWRCFEPVTHASATQALLGGLRFEDVPADRPLCVRLSAYYRGLDAAGIAACDEPAAGPGAQADGLTVCALSDVGAATASGSAIVIRDYRCGTLYADTCDALDGFCATTPNDCRGMPAIRTYRDEWCELAEDAGARMESCLAVGAP